MPPAGCFLDANLLVLLVVGSVDRELIAKHRRLRRFAVEDYERLLGLIARVERVFVTPNTLTETSNLLAQHRDPERSRFFDRLRFIIQESEEVVVAQRSGSFQPCIPAAWTDRRGTLGGGHSRNAAGHRGSRSLPGGFGKRPVCRGELHASSGSINSRWLRAGAGCFLPLASSPHSSRADAHGQGAPSGGTATLPPATNTASLRRVDSRFRRNDGGPGNAAA